MGQVRRGRRAQLRARRDALVAALRDQLPEWSFTIPAGGVMLWAELDGPISSALSRAARPMLPVGRGDREALGCR